MEVQETELEIMYAQKTKFMKTNKVVTVKDKEKTVNPKCKEKEKAVKLKDTGKDKNAIGAPDHRPISTTHHHHHPGQHRMLTSQ